MKFGVVIFPGSNCDEDMLYALETSMGQQVEELWHKRSDLGDYSKDDWIVLPGGFSYGDYLRAGAIARFSPIMEAVIDFAEKGGHVLGICNGFQVLCEAGLLPGALVRNTHQTFSCKNIYIKPENTDTPLTRSMTAGQPLKVPIAHSEGRYFATEKTLETLRNNEQVLFRYCDEDGQMKEEANPNGSVQHIAGICNKNQNVFGMMPHPERAADGQGGDDRAPGREPHRLGERDTGQQSRAADAGAVRERGLGPGNEVVRWLGTGQLEPRTEGAVELT
jgi:phosphoribosylformylglycinamidine synthase